MPWLLTAFCAIVAAYLIGSIPFAFLIVRWRKGIDIRTVGSGNVGATNVGRLLGLRYFLFTFGLDVAKGFLPTWVLPRLAEMLTHENIGGLPVLVGLAAILGHNYPLYLRFRGGKGVATSLGAFLALDPTACAGALAAFIIVLALTQYVSVSSISGGLAFTVVHFGRIRDPWSGAEAIMSAVTILMLAMLIVRHRANLKRIAAGTEPKVPLVRKKGKREG